MFRIKVCGLTNPADAAHAVSSGADAIGVNFHRGSPRFVPEEAAREIVEAVGNRAEVVAVFVNEAPETIEGLCRRLGIGRVQLHGDEPVQEASRVRLWRLKAVHASRPVDIEALRGYPCEAFLLDAGGPGAYGGTGKELPRHGLVGRFAGVLSDPGTPGAGRAWVLAGGLTPANVKRAIIEARPFAVDVASGVEASPGKKDPKKVEAFIDMAKEGFRVAGI